MSEMEFTLMPYRPGHDHQTFKMGKIDHGFIGLKEPRMVGLDRCPECGRENYYAAVLDCMCAWCGFDGKPHIPSPLPPPPIVTRPETELQNAEKT